VGFEKIGDNRRRRYFNVMWMENKKIQTVLCKSFESFGGQLKLGSRIRVGK